MLTIETLREAALKSGRQILSSEDLYRNAWIGKGPCKPPADVKGTFYFDHNVEAIDSRGTRVKIAIFGTEGVLAGHVSTVGGPGWRKIENFKLV